MNTVKIKHFTTIINSMRCSEWRRLCLIYAGGDRLDFDSNYKILPMTFDGLVELKSNDEDIFISLDDIIAIKFVF